MISNEIPAKLMWEYPNDWLARLEVLESSLLEYEGTLIFISHDRYFLNKIAERIMELTPQGVEYFLGNYDDYVDKSGKSSKIRQN